MFGQQTYKLTPPSLQMVISFLACGKPKSVNASMDSAALVVTKEVSVKYLFDIDLRAKCHPCSVTQGTDLQKFASLLSDQHDMSCPAMDPMYCCTVV